MRGSKGVARVSDPTRKTNPPETLEYWQPVLQRIRPQQALPHDRRVSPTSLPRHFQLDRVIDARLAKNLSRLAVSADGTIQELFLTAFQGLLFRYTETEEILVAWEMQGAPASVLPVRVSLTADHTFVQLLESTR